jgi:hypothetical protein
MIYFRFLSPHLEVNPAKKDSPELKLANRHSEIQSTKRTLGLETRLKKLLNVCKTPLKNISHKEKVP